MNRTLSSNYEPVPYLGNWRGRDYWRSPGLDQARIRAPFE